MPEWTTPRWPTVRRAIGGAFTDGTARERHWSSSYLLASDWPRNHGLVDSEIIFFFQSSMKRFQSQEIAHDGVLCGMCNGNISAVQLDSLPHCQWSATRHAYPLLSAPVFDSHERPSPG